MKSLLFIISCLMFAVSFFLIFNSKSIKEIIKISNFQEYTKEKILFSMDSLGIFSYSITLFCLGEQYFFYKKTILMFVFFMNAVFGYLIYKGAFYLLDQHLNNLDLQVPSQTLDFDAMLSALGIGSYHDIENESTISLEYGEFIAFEYCSTMIYCETYSNGIVHTAYYFTGNCSKTKNYILKNCTPLCDLSYWKNSL